MALPSLPIAGWAAAATELERSFPSWGEPDRVFLLRSGRHWVLCWLIRDSRSSGCRGLVEVDERDDANPVLGVVDATPLPFPSNP